MQLTSALTLLSSALAVAIDFGPTYGLDYSGSDYNVTQWHSPANMSANHWHAAMQECEALCLADPNCCTWTYCTPEGGASDPERCCLKYGVPPELNNSGTQTHWTGAAPRATGAECQNPAPPYPGPTWQHPVFHNSPGCLHIGGWHDIAGALYWDGVYNVFQGCPGSGGWHLASSTDLVHWDNQGVVIEQIQEPYGTSSPCSGFVTVDDDGTVCAGFRQCSGNWPGQSLQVVPLELRCALDNNNLTQWSTTPEYLFNFTFNRALPYDPVRPWKGTDGQWYATIAADGCNATAVPCAAGGREYLYTSPALRGPAKNWTLVGPMWTSNYTVLTPVTGATLDRELVTVDYIGNLTGDPATEPPGSTRVLTNNVCATTNACCGCTTAWYMGSQPGGEGSPFVVDYTAANATGMVDWGAFTPSDNGGVGIAGLASTSGQFMMARTLSTEPNQVAAAGRRVMIAWIGGGDAASQSLPRDLSLDPDGAGLLQAFVPELQVLRGPGSAPGRYERLEAHTPAAVAAAGATAAATAAGKLRTRQVISQTVEVLAVFDVDATAAPDAVFGVSLLLSEDGQDSVPVGVSLGAQQVYVKDRAGPLLPQPLSVPGAAPGRYVLHAYADVQIVEVLVNNRTALTVYSVPRDARSGLIELFGVDGVAVKATMEVWALDSI